MKKTTLRRISLLLFLLALAACGNAEQIQQTRVVEQTMARNAACADIRATRVSAIAECNETASDVADAQSCVTQAETYFNEWEAQNQCDSDATATPGVTEATPEATAEPTPGTAVLTYVDAQTEPVNCSQEQDGHFFVLTCNFDVMVEASYEAPTLPAYFFCRARGSGNSGNGFASVELTELSGSAQLTLTTTEVRKLYEDGDQNGAADPPIDDGDNMFTNRTPENDGMFVRLTCVVSEYDNQESGAWTGFECLYPDSEETGDCIGPWLNMAEAHAWD